MDLPKHEALFSQIRLSRYVTACNGDGDKAIMLYKYNIQASQAIYPIISILEVGLRNAIDRELTTKFNDGAWLINQRNQFANHPNMVYKDRHGNVIVDHFFTEKLNRAEGKLTYRQIPISHGKLLAELTFGFWVKFFDSNSIKILKGVPLQAFKNKPHIKLAGVHSHLNFIVTVRNRIAHNEPICFNNTGQICLVTLSKYEDNIMEALRWLDTDLHLWATKINFFRPVYNRISSL
jgi:Abi-like protein